MTTPILNAENLFVFGAVCAILKAIGVLPLPWLVVLAPMVPWLGFFLVLILMLLFAPWSWVVSLFQALENDGKRHL